MSPCLVGRNSIREMVKVRMDTAKLIAIKACDMLMIKCLRCWSERFLVTGVTVVTVCF